MRSNLLDLLRCPNGRSRRFAVFAHALRREGRTLTDADADPAAEIPLLRKLLAGAPAPHAALIEPRLARLQALTPNEVGDWNRGEMRFYDRDVDTPAKRAAFLETIRREPL